MARPVTLAALLAVALAAAALAVAQEGPRAELAWRRDVAAAFAEGRERNAPLFVVFRCET